VLGHFCSSITVATAGPKDQQDLCGGFARSGVSKFHGVGWTEGPTGSPIIDDGLAWVDCTLEAEHDAGDHHLVVGRVAALKAATAGSSLTSNGSSRVGSAGEPLNG
jgi:flavin reductase (DIM6/NTAB) family NADH-FMN oxidoreductase RutF